MYQVQASNLLGMEVQGNAVRTIIDFQNSRDRGQTGIVKVYRMNWGTKIHDEINANRKNIFDIIIVSSETLPWPIW